MKLFLWDINKKHKVEFSEISFREYEELSKLNIIISIDGTETKNLASISNYELTKALINFPSTNGLYSIPAKRTVKKSWYEEIELDVRIYISTEDFLHKYMNDIHLNTTDADKRYFFKGKHISPKLFVKKHLEKSKIPSRYNYVDPEHDTSSDSMYIELEKMKFDEIKGILRRNGHKIGTSKHEAILNLIHLSNNLI